MARTAAERDEELQVRIIQGQEARIGSDPGEIFIEWRPIRPVFYRVAVGDVIKDADRDVESPLIKKWRVTKLTPDRVVAENEKTGESREWNREELERKLIVQSFATNLTDFERVTVHQFGTFGLDEVEHSEHTYVGEPYVMVLAYGDNGEKYGQRYHFIERGDETDIELWRQDHAIEQFSDELRSRLDDRVTTALEAEGYRVVE
jgi:hypothetical protein